jgi:hypothetical protein
MAHAGKLCEMMSVFLFSECALAWLCALGSFISYDDIPMPQPTNRIFD